MYFKKLELCGFKSFNTTTVLEFERGISAVVGPNGSGKSNIADAIRFALGEQHMKNMRSKKSDDLIFSGSPTKSRMNMAYCAIYFDNKDKIFPVDYETVIIKRKIFRDGENQYFINDSQVRLKDLVEYIAKAHIGLKGYTIINQGMGDSILNASLKERKEIIFEALGLKEFQIKKSEAVSKLNQTRSNLEKARGIITEIEPHLRLLKKQVERLEERDNLEAKLKSLENQLLKSKIAGAQSALANLDKEYVEKNNRFLSVKLDLENINKDIETQEKQLMEAFQGVPQLEDLVFEIERERNSAEREMGKIEGMISALERDKIRLAENKKPAVTERPSIKYRVSNVVLLGEKLDYLDNLLKEILGQQDQVVLASKIQSFAGEFSKLVNDIRVKSDDISSQPQEEAQDNKEEIARIENDLRDLETQKSSLMVKLDSIDQKLRETKSKIKAVNDMYGKEREVIFELKNKKRDREYEFSNLENRCQFLTAEISKVKSDRDIFSKELQLLNSVNIVLEEAQEFVNEEEIRRSVERLKLRLENVDLIDFNVKTEYADTQKRYEFLTKESADLTEASDSLDKAISELDAIINNKFKSAFKSIDDTFDKYFKILFGGGSASLEIINTNKELLEEESEPAEPLAESEVNFGVDIKVHLPRKKVTSLSVLSGGERVLTSLALLFALISISPPPFLVLDEIDAPLDEANSIRFAKILNELKQYTQFIVITHNRETMHNSDILYGVTMQEDGVSKLLSLKFDEAVKVINS